MEKACLNRDQSAVKRPSTIFQCRCLSLIVNCPKNGKNNARKYLSISILKDFILLFILRFVGSLSAVAVKCEIFFLILNHSETAGGCTIP